MMVRRKDKLSRKRKPRPTPVKPDVRKKCESMLAKLRRHCPDLAPSGPLQEGQVNPPFNLPDRDIAKLTRAAMTPENGARTILWRKAGSEVLFHPQKTRIEIRDGLIIVGIVLESVQTKVATLTVPFAVGTEQRLANTVMVTEERPRGPLLLVEIWGDTVIAAAYEAVLQVISGMATAAGSDQLGQPLKPGAVIAGKGGLTVVPQAFHALENAVRRDLRRAQPGRIVPGRKLSGRCD
jgi:hypothetical protein